MAAKRYKLQGWNGKERGWLSFGVTVRHEVTAKMLCRAVADLYDDPRSEYRAVLVGRAEGETSNPPKEAVEQPKRRKK